MAAVLPDMGCTSWNKEIQQIITCSNTSHSKFYVPQQGMINCLALHHNCEELFIPFGHRHTYKWLPKTVLLQSLLIYNVPWSNPHFRAGTKEFVVIMQFLLFCQINCLNGDKMNAGSSSVSIVLLLSGGK